MGFDLANHPFFEAWTDPESGVTSYILTRRVAPLQQSFYFTNSSLSADEKWLWFYTAFPPSPHKFLGAVSLDPARPEIYHFLQAGFTSASPMVAPEGDAVFFCMGPVVWRLDVRGQLDKVCALDAEYINRRQLTRLATHLTVSADGKHLLLDGHVGNHWFVSVGDVAAGQVRIIKEFIHHFNHAQFSPVDPEVFILAQDWFYDAVTGRRFHYDLRTWLMDIHDSRFELLTPDVYCAHGRGVSHEWWSRDGRVCYVDYQLGAYEIDLATRQHTHVWKQALCHAHCDSTRRLWCADESPYKWNQTPCQVRAFDRETGRQINIVTALPLPPYGRDAYHIDPHPQFSPQDTYVVYTTTVRGQVDVALAPVQPIRTRLR